MSFLGVQEVSTTSGTGAYTLSGAIANSFTFASKVPDGEVVIYEATDEGQREFAYGRFEYPNILHRISPISTSNSNEVVDWPVTGQRVITAIQSAAETSETFPYPVATFLPGVLLGGSDDERSRATILITDAITLPAHFVGSGARARLVATAATVLLVNKISSGATTQIGTVTFAAGEDDGVLATTGGTEKSVAALDLIELLGPTSADDTLGDVSVTLRGTRA